MGQMNTSAYKLLAVAICLLAYPIYTTLSHSSVGFCYYQAANDLAPGDIDPEICTHVIVFSVSLGKNDEIVASREVRTAIEGVLKLKLKNSDLKVLVSIQDETGYWRKLRNSNDRNVVAANMVKFVTDKDLDGFDVYYTQVIKDDANCAANVMLLVEAVTLFRKRSLLLTLCIPTTLSSGCDYDYLREIHVDFVLVRVYNYGFEHINFTTHASPLIATNVHSVDFQTVVSRMHRGLGKRKNQMIIGFPSFSIPRILSFESSYRIGASTVPWSFANDRLMTYAEGVSVPYFRICSQYIDAIYEWDDESKGSYLHRDNHWLSFDSRRGLCYKTSRIATEKHIGGYMLWRLDMDDHKGHCGYGRFPIANYLKNNIKQNHTDDECDEEMSRSGRFCPKTTSTIVPQQTYNITFTNKTLVIDCYSGTVERTCLERENGLYWSQEKNNTCQNQEWFVQSSKRGLNCPRIASFLVSPFTYNVSFADSVVTVYCDNDTVVRRCIRRTNVPDWSEGKNTCQTLEDFVDELDKATSQDKKLTTDNMRRLASDIELLSNLSLTNRTIARKMLLFIGNLMETQLTDNERWREELNHKVVSILEHFASAIEIPNGVNNTISTEYISIGAFNITNLNISFKVDVTFVGSNLSGRKQTFPGPRVAIPNVVIRKLRRENIERIQLVAYNNSKLYKNNMTSGLSVQHGVLSVVINTEVEFNQRKTVIYYKIPLKKSATGNFSCVFWNQTMQNWSTNGVSYVTNKNGISYCRSTHLSSFSVMLSGRNTFAPIHDVVLSHISEIGCALSIFGSLITIVTYLLFKSLRREKSGKILINMCMSMILLNCSFFVFVETDDEHQPIIPCVAIASTLHYFLLTTLIWMMIEAVHMYQQLIVVFTESRRFYMTIRMLVAWGLPLVIVVITAAMSYSDNLAYHKAYVKAYTKSGNESRDESRLILNLGSINNIIDYPSRFSDNESDRRSALGSDHDPANRLNHNPDHNSDNDNDQYSDHDTDTEPIQHILCVYADLNPTIFYAAFLGPACLIIFFNTIIFFRVSKIVLRRSRIVHHDVKTKHSSVSPTQVRGAISVMFVLGVTWIFGPLAIGPMELTFDYLFTIFNSIQGFLVFFFRCVINTEARLAWKLLLTTGELKQRRGPLSDTSSWTSRMQTLKN